MVRDVVGASVSPISKSAISLASNLACYCSHFRNRIYGVYRDKCRALSAVFLTCQTYASSKRGSGTAKAKNRRRHSLLLILVTMLAGPMFSHQHLRLIDLGAECSSPARATLSSLISRRIRSRLPELTRALLKIAAEATSHCRQG